jgi:hypothetical protein
MGPFAGVDCNLTLGRLQSRIQRLYHGQLCARVDLNPMPESTLFPGQGLRVRPLDAWKYRPKFTLIGGCLGRPFGIMGGLTYNIEIAGIHIQIY